MIDAGDPSISPSGIEANTPSDAEARLALNRARLHKRLITLQADPPSNTLKILGKAAWASLPLARHVIRKNPYASVGGAMLAGVTLIRLKPWRGLGGSFLIGLLIRQVLTHSASSGSHALSRLWSSTQAGRKSV